MKKIILILFTILLACFQVYSGPWGRLKLVGNQLSSEDGKPIQLRGWSSHGFQWTGAYYNDYNDFVAMKENGATVFRIALYIQENGWQNKEWVQNCIDWTAQLNMYCLFDWHVLTPGDPRKYLKEGGLKDGKGNPVDAEAFFEWITSYVAEKEYNHVLYEICNEPNGDNNNMWAYVKEYAGKILPIIAKNDPGAITIIGTASWSQRIDWAVSNPIEADFGLPLMYAFHFYAGTHMGLINRLKTVAGQIPVFISEWGTTDSSGHGAIYLDNADQFMDVADGNNNGKVLLSWCNWSWSNDSGSGSCKKANDYSENNFTDSGKYVIRLLKKENSNGIETANNESFTIYPNPTGKGCFQIALNNTEPAHANIYSINGQLVYNTLIENGKGNIDTQLQAGIYLITVQTKNNKQTQKLIVKN